MADQPYYGYVENPVLDSLELSTRADRVLRMYGRIKTLDDFMALTKEQVMALKGAGVRTWGEIKTLQKNLREGHPEVNAMLDGDTVSGTVRAVYKDPSIYEMLFSVKPDISLRDQAALAALPAIIQVCAGDKPREIGTETYEQMFARKAWAVADAFIAAREGKTDA